jgi:hypothetical protein
MQIVPAEVHDILCLFEQQEAWTVTVHWFTVIAVLGVLSCILLFEHLSCNDYLEKISLYYR